MCILQIVMPLILTLLVGGFWLWMGWDLGGNSEITGNEKFYWMLAFIFLNVFAVVFYYVNQAAARWWVSEITGAVAPHCALSSLRYPNKRSLSNSAPFCNHSMGVSSMIQGLTQAILVKADIFSVA